MAKRFFGELELTILNIFKANDKLTVRDVLTALGNEDKYTTIMTVMNRLVEKNVLIRQRNGQLYDYWMNPLPEDTSPSLLEKLKHKIFGGNTASMAAYLIESNDISDGDLEKIEKIIEGVRQSRKQS